jgi:ubiquinone/menaquinone biosynthesis C-methylase UbiE
MSIEKYFYSSPMNWFREGENSRYSDLHWSEINRQTLKASKSVLEVCQRTHNPIIGVVGFGFGRETEVLLQQGVQAKIVGLDINHSRFNEAKKIRPNLFGDHLNPVTASMNISPFADETFDATLCLETMMHSDNPVATLRELTRVTKSDGIIVFNMSTTQESMRDFAHMLSIEGLPRIIDRFKERMLSKEDNSSKRTRLYTREQIEGLIQNNEHTQVVETSSYLMGLSTYIVLRKFVEAGNA